LKRVKKVLKDFTKEANLINKSFCGGPREGRWKDEKMRGQMTVETTSNEKFLRGESRCFTGAVFSKSAPFVEFPEAFTYSRLLFRFKLLEKSALTVFKASMLRGLMGKALHRLNCQSRGSCKKCKLVTTCAYSILFKPELVFKNQLTTPPFVLFSPNKKETFAKGDELEFTLTIFGEYSRYFDYFLNAFNYARGFGLGSKRTPYEIESITDDISNAWVYRDMQVNKQWKVAFACLSGLNRETPKNPRNLRIHFLSPTFLKVAKKQVYFPGMTEIIRAVIRRVHILSRSIWKDMEFKIDKSFLEDLYFNIDRYDLCFDKSFKTGGLGHKVELSGFYGVVDYGGDFSYLYPLLRAGELVHIGARMSYGLGKYEVVDL
jgi:hypothetical protein